MTAVGRQWGLTYRTATHSPCKCRYNEEQFNAIESRYLQSYKTSYAQNSTTPKSPTSDTQPTAVARCLNIKGSTALHK
ncbi:hypothetical protein HZ326_14268 [Fusarium oxysporum f. sp. albedinis]|nr:hypothetical protein HZ326_14268 [Fusarium oxysporum f. sp. albedinis]